MFASTEPSQFPPAILSRLQRYDVRRLTVAEIEGKLSRILEADGRVIEPGALTLIARLAAGGMRDAESILDQVLSTTTGEISEAAVRDLLGLADAAAVEGFVEALLDGDVPAGIGILDRLDERGRDPRALLDQVVDVVRARLIDPGTTDQAALAEAARRLVAIDPDRTGIGGLRLQLELALFSRSAAAPGRPAPSPVAATAPTARTEPARAQPPTMEAAPTEPAIVEPASAIQRSAAEPARPAAAPKPPRTATASAAPAQVEAAAPAASGSVGTEATAPDTAGPADVRPTEPPVAKDPVPVTVGVGNDLERLVGDWPEIVKSVSPATRAVLSECRPIAVDGNVVTLGFPEAKSFLKDHAERRKSDVETAVGGHLGRPVSVRAVATNIEVAPLVAAEDLVAEARRIFGEDLVEVAEID